MLSRPKNDQGDPSVRNEIENVFTVRTKAENIFSVRIKAEIIFTNFVTYWKLRGYNFHVWLKGLSKNFYNKPWNLSQRT